MLNATRCDTSLKKKTRCDITHLILQEFHTCTTISQLTGSHPPMLLTHREKNKVILITSILGEGYHLDQPVGLRLGHPTIGSYSSSVALAS